MKKVVFLLSSSMVVACLAGVLASDARTSHVLYFPINPGDTVSGCRLRGEGYVISPNGFAESYVTTIPGAPCISTLIATTFD